MNKEKLEEKEKVMQGLEVKYYYIDKNTVCLLVRDDGKVVSRGIAFCSYRDQFCKETGRHIAFIRAYNAYVNKENAGKISRIDLLTKYEFYYKLSYCPVPTLIELKLLGNFPNLDEVNSYLKNLTNN